MTDAWLPRLFIALLPLLAIGGCAERDNPYDPINGFSGTNPPNGDSVVPEPKPSETAIVVDPDSVCRTCDFYATLETALAESQPSDTVWIQGGRTYAVQDLLNISKGGTFLRPFVVRSFGGEARFIPARDGIQNLLRISQPYVEIRGIAIVGAQGDGVLVNNVVGPVRIDSSRIDSCGISGAGVGLHAGPAGVHLVLHDVQFKHNATSPALRLDAGVVIDDSIRVVEIPRP